MNKILVQQEARKALVDILSQLASETPMGLLWAPTHPNMSENDSSEIAYRTDGQIRIWGWDGKTNHKGDSISALDDKVQIAFLAGFITCCEAPAATMKSEHIDQEDFNDLLQWAAQSKKSPKP